MPAAAIATPVLADSHCHLPLLAATDGGLAVADAVAAAREAGVTRLLSVAVALEDHAALTAIAAVHPEVRCSVGVHPNSAGGEEPTVERLARLAGDPGVVAVGETGLDYFRSTGDLEWQRDRFRRHIRAARETGLPLIIHSRDAAPDVLRLLAEERAADVGGVMHCFVDDWEVASRALDMGFLISFSGVVTFRNARQVRDVAIRLPLDRILVETDAPYLAPVPHRGRVNQPAWVRHVAEAIATARGIPYPELAAATLASYLRVFRLPSAD